MQVFEYKETLMRKATEEKKKWICNFKIPKKDVSTYVKIDNQLWWYAEKLKPKQLRMDPQNLLCIIQGRVGEILQYENTTCFKDR